MAVSPMAVSPETFVLQVGVPDYLQGAVAGIVNFLPRLLGALLVLLIGWIVGRVIGGVVRRLADRTDVDRLVMNTPLGGALGGTPKAVSGSLGRIAAYFVYALAILAAADALSITLLSEWLATAVAYLPAFVAGALIIVLGFVLADFLADVVGGTETLTSVRYTEAFADGLRIFLYFVVVVVGLDTMGVDVQILYLFAGALAGGLALGAALAVGIAFGLGGRDYVASNIGTWLPGRPPAGESAPMGQADGGEESVD
ncbi:MAG: hypothetical protein ABEJ81_01070 [Haloferacaceae archaeon]